MTIHHLAIWTFRLEELKTFYTTYFKGKSNEKYINPQKGFESYFISFNGGATLELMSPHRYPTCPYRGKQTRANSFCLFLRQQRRSTPNHGITPYQRIYHCKRAPNIG